MSNLLKLKFILAAGLGLLLGAFGMHYFSLPHMQDANFRGLASVNPKLEALPGAALAQMKHLGAITVRLEAPEKIPVDSQDSVELSGSIVLNQGPAQDMDVEWTLPADVRVISGNLVSQISQMQPGKSYPISLVVSGFDKTDKKIVTVSASTIRNGIKIGNSSLVSSRPEDSMEYIAPALADSAAELDSAPQFGNIIK